MRCAASTALCCACWASQTRAPCCCRSCCRWTPTPGKMSSCCGYACSTGFFSPPDCDYTKFGASYGALSVHQNAFLFAPFWLAQLYLLNRARSVRRECQWTLKPSRSTCRRQSRRGASAWWTAQQARPCRLCTEGAHFADEGAVLNSRWFAEHCWLTPACLSRTMLLQSVSTCRQWSCPSADANSLAHISSVKLTFTCYGKPGTLDSVY